MTKPIGKPLLSLAVKPKTLLLTILTNWSKLTRKTDNVTKNNVILSNIHKNPNLDHSFKKTKLRKSLRIFIFYCGWAF